MFHQDHLGPFMILYGRRYYTRCTRGKVGIMVQNNFYPVEYEETIKYITKDGIKHMEDVNMFANVTSDEPDILNPTCHAVNIYIDSVRQEYANRYGMERAWILIPLHYHDKNKAIEEIKKNRDNLKNVSSILWQNIEFLEELLNEDIGNIRSFVPNSMVGCVMSKIRTIKQKKQHNRYRVLPDSMEQNIMVVDLANKEVI